jgi:YegS/Rv2252/BmrU family lipid kinase
MPTLNDSSTHGTETPHTDLIPNTPHSVGRTPDAASLIVNTRARRGQEWYEKAQICLRENGVRIADCHAITEPATLPEAVRTATRRGIKRVIVGGGDGTLRAVANQLANTDITLGVLPLGTVNDLARNLGIKPEVEAACRVIADGYTVRIDTGQANGEVFLLTASVGFSAQSQTALKPELKRMFGPFGYLAASLMALRSLRQMRVRVCSEGVTEEYPILQAGVIKGHEWMGGRCRIPGLSLETGHLAYYALFPQPGLSYLRIIHRLMRGQFYHTPGLRSFAAREVTIETSSPMPLVLDGDLCGHTPVHLRVLPEALRVFVPADFPNVCDDTLDHQRRQRR